MAEPWTMLNIDGQPRPLRLNGAALSDFETTYARSIGVPEYPFGKVIKRYYDELTRFEVLSSYNLLAHIVWAGLKWRWTTLTPQVALLVISEFEEKGGDIIVDVWAVLEQAWISSGMFKHVIQRAEKEAGGQRGNVQTEPEKTTETGNESPSTSSGSAAGTTAQVQ